MKPYARLLNLACAVICSPALLIHAVVVASILLKNFESIKKLHPDTQRFSGLFEKLKIPANITNRVEVTSGKHTIIYPFWSILRRLIIGVTVTTLTEYPLICVAIMILTTLISIIIMGTQDPFTDRVMRIMDLFNEWIVLLINYHLLCLTNFVSDPTAREHLGYSLTGVTCLFILINLGYASHGIQTKSCKRVKYWMIRTKNLSIQKMEKKK